MTGKGLREVYSLGKMAWGASCISGVFLNDVSGERHGSWGDVPGTFGALSLPPCCLFSLPSHFWIVIVIVCIVVCHRFCFLVGLVGPRLCALPFFDCWGLLLKPAVVLERVLVGIVVVDGW